MPPAERLGRPFAVLWGATFLFYLGFQFLLPVMPFFATDLGLSEAHVGLIIGVFAFAAMIPRPVAGALADRIGRRPLVLAGTAIFAVASFAYPLTGGIVSLLGLRLFHGIGMGFGPTAATVMAADLAPPARRGAAMGVFGLATAVGLAVGPYAGIEVQQRLGFTATFLIAGALELAGLLLAWTLPETRPPLPPPALAAAEAPGGALQRFGTRWFSRAAVYPSLLLFTLYFSYGGLVSFLPLFARHRGLGNPGVFFAAFALATLAVRSPAGQLTDRIGRRLVAAPSLVLAGLGLVGLGRARSLLGVLGAAALYGVGFGAGQPALLAMTGDRAAPAERGRAMGTFYTAWELGISGGSVLLGLCIDAFGYDVMWWIAAGVAGLGAALATRDVRRHRG